MTNTDTIPEWAKQKACDLANAEGLRQNWSLTDFYSNGAVRALARYIAEHEQPPADPLLLEAREIAASVFRGIGQVGLGELLSAGTHDDNIEMCIALAALRRGVELAGERP